MLANSVRPLQLQQRPAPQPAAAYIHGSYFTRFTRSVATAAAPRDSAEALGTVAEHQQVQTSAVGLAPRQQLSETQQRYPYLDVDRPGVEVLHAEPPVYLVHSFLQPGHCHALQQAALNGQLPSAAYNDAVLFDYHKLSYLGIVVAVGAAAQALLSWQHGASANNVLQSAAAAAAVWSGIAAVLAVAVRTGVILYTKGRCFTGSKWSTEQLQPGNPTAEAVETFVDNVCKLLDTQPSKLEVPLVTRYCQGEYQRVHVDARPLGDSQGAAAWLAAGGQRLVQIVVYLNHMSESHGGCTAFHHPALKGLTVRPEQGAALVFFTAFADGSVDDRMSHSGEPVLEGEKWIVNTWATQYSKDKV